MTLNTEHPFSRDFRMDNSIRNFTDVVPNIQINVPALIASPPKELLQLILPDP